MDNLKPNQPRLPVRAAEPPDAPVDDARLTRQAQAGCAASFEKLVERHTPRLLRFLSRRTGQRHDAEDLVQETWARAYRFLQSYDPDQSFAGWLWTIAARLDVNRRRKKGLPLAPWRDDLVAVPGDASRNLIEQERRNGLWALTRRCLTPPQRDALWLFYAEEMSVKDVARILNVSTVSAKVLLFRARRRLGAALRENGEAEELLVGWREGAEI